MRLFALVLTAFATAAPASDLPTLEELGTIAGRFHDAVKSAGMDLSKPLPQVFIRNRPGFSVYHPKENEITFPDWHSLTEEARVRFAETGASLGEPIGGERYFSETFRYFFVHELCHWVQSQELRIDDISKIDDPYGIEFQANQCAIGFWEAAEPVWMRGAAARMTAVLARRTGPMPWGTQLRSWFNQRYPDKFGGDYGTAQFRMVLDAWNASPRSAFTAVMDRIGREGTRRFYDARYREGKLAHLVLKDASPLLVESIRGRAPGAALDLGVGEGRNSLYLASEKWRVTGVDLSRVGVESAQKAAQAGQLSLELIVSDLDEYDIGNARWDLVTSFYMQDWHYHSRTNTFARIAAGIRPGGLFVLEGFGPPRLRQDAIEKAFAGWRILRGETVETEAEWGRGRGKRVVVRFVAQKP